MLDFPISNWLMVEAAIVIAAYVFAALMIGDVLKQRRAPAATAAWLLVIGLLPVAGILLYLLFGARKLARPRMRLGRSLATQLEDVVESPHAFAELLVSLGAHPAQSGHSVQIHSSPQDAFQALLAVIATAKTRLIIDMYAFDDDEVGSLVFEALIAAARNGVQVYVLIDDIGSIKVRSRNAQALRQVGGKLVRFKPVAKLFRLKFANLRNHRKIVVADGAIAWTGGRNIARSYLTHLSHPAAWQDLSCTISGPAARVMDDIALADWRYATGEKLPPLVAAASLGQSIVQVIASGPDLRADTWHTALLSLCFTAKRRIWIMTPYFVPDEALQNALAIAIGRGVELQIVVPKRSDNWLVDRVRVNYLRELALLGAQVYVYKPRMLHAKALLVDDQIAALGTANMDARSLFLNYEVMTVLYTHADIANVGQYFREQVQHAEAASFRRSWLRDSLAAPLRLLAPLL